MPPSNNRKPALKSTIEQIAAQIRSDIEDGALPPGEALNQVKLAQSFNLSRIPIREALRQLEAEGYVTSRPNKGATVIQSPQPEDVLEIIDIRECVELRLMYHAVGHMTSSTLRVARTALRALNSGHSPAELRGAHERFHTILFQAGERPLMTSLINEWRFRIDERPDVDGTKRRAYAKAVADIHERLLTACERRDEKAVALSVADEYHYLRSIANDLIKPESRDGRGS